MPTPDSHCPRGSRTTSDRDLFDALARKTGQMPDPPLIAPIVLAEAEIGPKRRNPMPHSAHDASVTSNANTPTAARPRLGVISFLHRFGSALNHHVHLHACVTDGVFKRAADEAGCDGPPLFVPARPIIQADLTTLTERVRRGVIRWFRITRLLDATAAADMLAWENSGFSVDASVRITLIDRDMPSYFRSLEHLLRYCARPPFALHRLSVIRSPDCRITRIRYVMPRHKHANWVGPGRGRQSTRPRPSSSLAGPLSRLRTPCLDVP